MDGFPEKMIHHCSDERSFCHDWKVIPAFSKNETKNTKSKKMPTHGEKKEKLKTAWYILPSTNEINMNGR